MQTLGLFGFFPHPLDLRERACAMCGVWEGGFGLVITFTYLAGFRSAKLENLESCHPSTIASQKDFRYMMIDMLCTHIWIGMQMAMCTCRVRYVLLQLHFICRF